MVLVMGSHWIFHAGVGIVDVLHRDVAVTVAALRGRHGRRGVARMMVQLLALLLLLLWCQAALVLIEFEAGGWLLLRLRRNLRLRLRLAVTVVSRRQLPGAVVSSRAP